MSLLSKIKDYAKPIAKSSICLGAGLVSLLGNNAIAQTAPRVEWTNMNIDQDGVLSLTATNLVAGKYYMAGFTEDLSQKFQPVMNDFYLATTNNETFYTDLPSYTESGYFVMASIELPTTTFSQEQDQTVTGKFTTQINTTGDVNHQNNQLWLYDWGSDTPYFFADVNTNNLSVEIDTQNYFNSYYGLESWQKVNGTDAIEGLESFWFNSGSLYFANNNDFSSNDPTKSFSNFNGTPTFNFAGIPGKEYIAELYSINESGQTNLIGDTTLSEADSLANGGAFSMMWDRSNDPGTPNYFVNVVSPDNSPSPAITGQTLNKNNVDGPIVMGRTPGSTYTNVYQMRVGSSYIKPFNTWLHADEEMVTWPYSAAYSSSRDRHAEAAGVIELLYPFDWGNLYGINQTKYPESPYIIKNAQGVTNFLEYMRTSDNPGDSRWVSYVTLFAHMNDEECVGGTGSSVPSTDGFNYRQLAAVRGTVIGESGEYKFLDSTKGAADGAFLEGCDSSGGNRALFLAMGIVRWDAYYGLPNWGQGQNANVPVVREWVLAKRNTRITEDYVSESQPTIGDAIFANKFFYPEGIPFIDNFGCMHKYYAKGMGISADVSTHSFPTQQFFYNPGFSNAPAGP